MPFMAGQRGVRLLTKLMIWSQQRTQTYGFIGPRKFGGGLSSQYQQYGVMHDQVWREKLPG